MASYDVKIQSGLYTSKLSTCHASIRISNICVAAGPQSDLYTVRPGILSVMIPN